MSNGYKNSVDSITNIQIVDGVVRPVPWDESAKIEEIIRKLADAERERDGLQAQLATSRIQTSILAEKHNEMLRSRVVWFGYAVAQIGLWHITVQP